MLVVLALLMLISVYSFSDENDLFDVIDNGNIEEIQNKINIGNVNTKNREGETLLIYAAKYVSNPKIIDVLVLKGADIEAKDNKGATALIRAIKDNNARTDITAALINNRAGVNSKIEQYEDFMYPLMIAATRDNIDIIKFLIKAGANVNAIGKIEDETMTALILASLDNENPEAINILLSAGADINFRTEKDFTALLCAIGNKNPKIFEMLIDNGADVTMTFNWFDKKTTILHIYAEGGKDIKILDKLIFAGADINVKTSDNMTPLIYAASLGKDEFVERLIDKGADVTVKSKAGKITALHMYAFSGKDTKILDKLIAAGSDINAKADYNVNPTMTPLSFAVSAGNVVFVETLINEGADVNADSNILFYALLKENLDVIKMLLAKGAIRNVDENNLVFYAHLNKCENPEIIKAFQDAGYNATVAKQ